MNRKPYVFFGLVVAAATLLVYNLPADLMFALPARHAVGLAFFVLVAVIGEVMAIEFGSGKPARSSLAFLPFLASIVVFAPFSAVTAAALVSAFSTIVLSKQSPFKALFNISQAVLAVGAAAIIYQLLLPHEMAVAPVRASISYIGFPALAVAFFAANIGLASVAISLIRQQPFLQVLQQVVGPRGSNLVYDFLASPIAIVLAMLYSSHYILGIIIILLPLLLIRYSYLSKLQLEEANRDLLKVLVKAIETRDPYTSGHSLRVAALSKAVAQDLNLPKRKVDEIETAALLHDIGKIDSVYEAVIRKPHDLTDHERILIKTHATRGADLLQSLSSVSREVIRAVRHHHERYDGTGYPDGMRGEEIPLAGRIIMMSDSVDAMLSDRPYRRALSITKVRSELIRCSGSQFDPELVQTVLRNNTLERAAELVGRPHNPDLQIVAHTESA
jgi:putative nucleotidyltransferase with HDIG domain